MATMNLKVAKGFKLGTKRLSIDVPDQLRVRLRTGLEWIDDALGDGLVPSTVMMLTGMPGTGKSTTARQIANALASNPDVVPVYNSGEESLYQVQLTCERMELQNDFMVGEETELPKLIEFLKKVQDKNPKKYVVLLQDSLQTLNDMYYKDGGTTSGTAVRCAQLITDWAKESYGCCIFVGQSTKNGDFAGRNTIKHAVDAHGILAYDKNKKSPTFGRLLFEVPKNRFGSSGMTYVMQITKKGLESLGSFQKGQDWEGPGSTGKDEAEEDADYDAAAE